MNTDASILVYKFRPERTGFKMNAEFTQLKLTFLAFKPCLSHYISVCFKPVLNFKYRCCNFNIMN